MYTKVFFWIGDRLVKNGLLNLSVKNLAKEDGRLSLAVFKDPYLFRFNVKDVKGGQGSSR